MKRAPCILLALLLTALPAAGYPTGPGETTIRLTWGAMYDSNLLHYSPSDRTAFEDGTEKWKSPIRALDDLRTDYKVSAEFSGKFWGKRKAARITSLRATVNFAHHLMDPIKNMGWLSVNARQDISKQFIAGAGFFFEPRFYIRDYFDKHTQTYQRCEFTLYQLKGELSYRPRWLWEVTGWGRVKNYRYNEFFTEYDGDFVEGGVATVARPGPWRFSAEYGFGSFDNTGFNSADPVPAGDVTELGQGDYQEDSFSASARYNFKVASRSAGVEAGTELARRLYTTDRDPRRDPMHSGRQDFSISVDLTGRLTLTERVELEAGLGYSSREAEGDSPSVSEAKNFSRRTAWLGIRYEFK